MQMMLSDDPSKFFGCFVLIEIRSHAPYNVTGLFADDGKNVGISCINDDIIRMETLIALIIPFVLA